MTSLRRKTVVGIGWSTVSQAGRQIFQLLTLIILAKLLQPSDFGLMGMALVVIGFVTLFQDLGTTAVVVQRKTLSKRLSSTLFWVNVLFGVIVAATMAASAPLIALFFHQEQLIPILQVFSIGIFISSFGLLHKALQVREMAFDLLAKIELGAVVLGSIAGIVSALSGAGVWSLVLQNLVSIVAFTFALWFLAPYRVQLVLSWQEINKVRNYAINLTGFTLINFFIRNADNLLIGRCLGAQELGLYTLAYRILLFPVQSISAVIGRVMFPAFSKIQDDNSTFRSVYLRLVAAIAFISFPMMIGILILAEPFVLSVFSEQWHSIILLIVIFAPVGLIQSIGGTVGDIYTVKGRSDWLFRWGLAAGFVVLLSFVIGLQRGIVGVATCYAIAVFLLMYPNFAIPFQLIELSVQELIQKVSRTFICSVLMALILIFLQNTLLSPSLSVHVNLLISIIIGIAVYAIASWLINRALLLELWSNLTLLWKRA